MYNQKNTATNSTTTKAASGGKTSPTARAQGGVRCSGSAVSVATTDI
jgi:hypothetical protein